MNALTRSLLTIVLLLPGRTDAFDASEMVDMMRIMSGMMGLWNTFSSVDSSDYGNNNLPVSLNRPWRAPTYGYPGNYAGLDGVWHSRRGPVMEIRGNRFRLHMRGQRMLEGQFIAQRNRFIAYISRTDTTLAFLFERRGNTFILKEINGSIYMFHRW